jgi:DNA-binding transcriptional LysR family regulator
VNTDFLRSFITAVQHGSMAEAARRLNLSPAAVAQHVRGLEQELGASLMVRSGRTVAATEAGQRILERARNVLRDVGDLRAVANDQALSGELRLGAGTNALLGIVPEVLKAMVARYPAINVYIRPSFSVDMYPAVESGDLDAAIVLEAPFAMPKTLQWELLREEPLVLLAPARLAGRDPHELLASEPLVRYDRTQWGGQQAEQYLRRSRITPRERCEINALSAIAVMVDRGLGVSLVPDWIRPWPEGVNLVRIPLPLPAPPRRVGMIWSRASVRLRLVEAFRREAVRLFKPARKTKKAA